MKYEAGVVTTCGRRHPDTSATFTHRNSIAEAPEELVNATESNISFPWPRYKGGTEMSGNNTDLKDTL
jgi:hypothetical protein